MISSNIGVLQTEYAANEHDHICVPHMFSDKDGIRMRVEAAVETVKGLVPTANSTTDLG